MQDIQNIYHLFLQFPYLNACLVFDNNNFSGILLKKDLEDSLKMNDNFLVDKIINISKDAVEELLFNETPKLKMQIPFISLMGEVQGLIFYDEFVSEFFTDDFLTRLSLQEVFGNLMHPILIMNRFKRILYLNKKAEEIFSQQALGQKVSDVMLSFDINCGDDNRILISRQHECWQLLISESVTPFAKYYIYQLI